MTRTKVFRNGRSKAVRIPKEYELEEGEVFVNKIGNSIVITPIRDAAEQFNLGISMFTDDFLAERMPQEFDPPKVDL